MTSSKAAFFKGGLFLGYYASYMCYVLLASSHHALLESLSSVMLYFVIPLTAVTLGIAVVRRTRVQRRGTVSLPD